MKRSSKISKRPDSLRSKEATMNNLELIKDAKAQAGLTYEDIAKLCRVSIHTVKAWMKPNAKSGSKPSDAHTELLFLKLGLKSPYESTDKTDN